MLIIGKLVSFVTTSATSSFTKLSAQTRLRWWFKIFLASCSNYLTDWLFLLVSQLSFIYCNIHINSLLPLFCICMLKWLFRFISSLKWLLLVTGVISYWFFDPTLIWISVILTSPTSMIWLRLVNNMTQPWILKTIVL